VNWEGKRKRGERGKYNNKRYWKGGGKGRRWNEDAEDTN